MIAHSTAWSCLSSGFNRLKTCVLMAAGLALLTVQHAQALTVQRLPIAGTQAVVVTVDIRHDQLQLFLKDSDGHLYQSFAAIKQQLAKQALAKQQGRHNGPALKDAAAQQLVFAMNAGMFHPDYLPVGLYIEQARELYPLNTATGSGNFFMQPNGVFLLNAQGVQVMSTADFQAAPPAQILLATQSGPLLVYQGKINSRFNPASGSRFIRNAVGVKQSSKAVFVISEQPVSFYELADFFKNTLNIDNALYLDGSISSLYLPALNRHDRQRFLGPIIGVTQRVN